MPSGPSRHFVYIVRCADGSFYTGYARDPEARIAAHNLGRGAKYTSTRRPVTLVYLEEVESTGAALKREHRVKCLTRAGKEALVAAFSAQRQAPALSPPTDRAPARRRRGRTTRTSPPQS